MKRKVLKLLFIICFVSTNSYAIDPSIYYGKWKSNSSDIDIELNIENKDKVLLTINNKKINDVEISFPYGKSAMFPFMFLFSKNGDVEYSLYFTIGTNGPEIGNLNIIRGFYIHSEIGKDQYGEISSKHYPIELLKK